MKNRVLLIALIAFFGMSSAFAQSSVLKKRVVYNNSNRTALEGVVVKLSNEAGEVLGYRISDEQGYYNFGNIDHGVYTVTGTYDLDIEDVDILDPALILNNIMGLYPIEENTLKFHAADVNKNGIIDMEDHNLVLFNLLEDVEFPAGKWQFESYTFEHCDNKAMDEDHPRGTASGDVNSTWDPDVCNMPLASNVTQVMMTTQNQVVVPVSVNCSDVSGYYVEMSFDVNHMDVVEVEAVNANDYFNYKIENNILKVTAMNAQNLNDNELFNVRVNLNEGFASADLIGFNVEASQFTNNRGESKEGAINMPKLKFGVSADMVKVYPNPASTGQNIQIEYMVPVDGQVTVNVYNNLGQLVKVLVDSYQQSQTYRTSVNDLTPGYYFYQVKVNGSVEFNTTDRFIVQ